MSDPLPSIRDTVRTEQGLARGVPGADAAVVVFKGLPYAAPPTGELRWRPPEPAPAWQGVRRADTFGPICPQHGPAAGSFYQQEFYLQDEPRSEDCLYLNVWTGAESPSERRPVMVWFHGGALIEGSGSLPSFHGEALARKGVVLVTANYRLGVFGYFAHPALSAESPRGVCGNYGLLDQVAALRWVRANIASFGGDPQNVTIFGQSAGSMSAFALAVSPPAAGLFRRAIGQSGAPLTLGRVRPLREAERAGAERAQEWGAETARELRALPAHALLPANSAEYFAAGYGLVIDGWALPDEPGRLMAAGRHHVESLMVGATADEWSPMAAGQPMSAEAFRQSAAERYGERADEFLRLYPAPADTDVLRAQIASGSDELFAGMRAWAGLHHRRRPGTAFLYYFDRRLPGRNSALYGAFHSSELYYVFGTLDSTDRPWEEADRRLSDAMTSYWANFAAAGDPNGPGLPAWPAYDESDAQVMALGEQVRAMPLPKPERLAFFARGIVERLEQNAER
jgi:para-nitrobenzyl esterase